MKLQHLLGSVLAVGGAAWILIPSDAEAYLVDGSGLSPSQRDFRVYNNFTDAAANNNVTADTNFPGALGAVMAIWKACIEWGSVLHGNGNGDPSQPAGLGSGGANFDAAYAGQADGIGSTDDNIFSEISGSSGGVLAYTEVPSENGWRIRFYSTWSWADGPTTSIGTGTMDIQGVACHEYGHALGLGHTGSAGATMEAVASGNATALRSIEADDIAGIQAIYGAMSASKPRITGVTVSGSTLVITGQNFAASGNEIWFAPPSTTTAGTVFPMVLHPGQSSTGGGTQLSIGVPSNAGDGDVFVKLPGIAFDSLSNGWPVNVNPGPPCSSPINACVSSPNSFSPFGATMSYTGTVSVAQNNLTLLCYDIPPAKLTIFYYGRTASGTYVMGNGTRCVDGPLYRLLPAVLSDAGGIGTRVFDLNAVPSGGSMVPGNTMHASAYYRDPPAGGANFNTANVLSWTWCP